MRKIAFTFIALVLAVLAFCIPSYARQKPVDIPEIKSVVQEFRPNRDFQVVSIGGIAMSFLKKVAATQVEDEEDRAALQVLRKVRSIMVVSYEDCADNIAESFNRKMSRALEGCELLAEIKDDGDNVSIYAEVPEDGGYVKNIVFFSPGSKALILIKGKLSTDDFAPLFNTVEDL